MLKFLVPAFIPFLCAFAAWPAYFVPNMGQWAGEFAYRCDVGNASYWITASGMTIAVYAKDEGRRMKDGVRRIDQRCAEFSDRIDAEDEPVVVRGHALMMRFVDANPCFELVPDEPLTSYSNYFKGRDSCQWHSRVPNYQRVIAKEVWPGIDVEYKVDQRGVETVFRVQPGADISRIMIEYEGLDAPLRLDGQGNLVLTTSVGELHEQAPFAFQDDGRLQKSVPVRYAILGKNRYGFACEEFDSRQELVIDPLLYSTYFVGSVFDDIHDMTSDANGNKIVCGDVGPYREGFPVTPGAFQTEYPGTLCNYVMKLNPEVTEIQYCTYVYGGGRGKVLCTPEGSIYLVIQTGSPNFPLTPDALDTVVGEPQDGDIAFARLSADLSTLEYGTYLGGSGQEHLGDVELNSRGCLYIYGTTESQDFYITDDALWTMNENGVVPFLSVFDPITALLTHSTYLFAEMNAGHYAMELTSLEPEIVWITGITNTGGIYTTSGAFMEGPLYPSAFFTLIDLNNSTILYSSLLGSSTSPNTGGTYIGFIAQIDSNEIILSGTTTQLGFPMPPGGYDSVASESDIFVFDLELPNHLISGTFVGAVVGGTAVKLEAGGTVLIVGGIPETGDFPVTPDALIPHFTACWDGPPCSDVVIARLSADLRQLLYGSYFGGNYTDDARAVVYEGVNSIWIAGETSSFVFPLTNDALCRTYSGGFIMRFSAPITSTDEHPHPIPNQFAFSTYPDPFNPTTTLVYSLPHPSRVILDVFNTLGQQVKRIDVGRMAAGDHHYLFSADDLPSGTYFARLNAEEFLQTRKMVVVK